MATFDLPEVVGPNATATIDQRNSLILKHATAGDLDVEWTPLNVAGRIELLVTADAVKLGGVRINVSAYLQQQLADALGALLFTPKVSDLHYMARSVTIPPFPMPITASTEAMQHESAKMDAAIQAAGGVEVGAIVGTVGKHWVIDPALAQHPGRAENYGWYMPAGTKSPWQGVAIYPSVTLQALVIQQPSWAHDPSHVDYSQQCSLMHRSCRVDGQDRDLSDVLADPYLAPMLSHDGPIPKTLQRQPGVPLFACAMPPFKGQRVQALVSSGLCPTPPRPSVAGGEPAASKLPYVLTGLLGLATGVAVGWALTDT